MEMPQNLDNMNDGITMEELFPDGNSNFNDANGFQVHFAALAFLCFLNLNLMKELFKFSP